MTQDTVLRTVNTESLNETLKPLANAIRALAMDAVQKANSGHPGMPMGMADVATVLFSKYLKFDVTNPTWPDRDRFILSGGIRKLINYEGLKKDVELKSAIKDAETYARLLLNFHVYTEGMVRDLIKQIRSKTE